MAEDDFETKTYVPLVSAVSAEAAAARGEPPAPVFP